jgi:hypothetical protein
VLRNSSGGIGSAIRLGLSRRAGRIWRHEVCSQRTRGYLDKQKGGLAQHDNVEKGLRELLTLSIIYRSDRTIGKFIETEQGLWLEELEAWTEGDCVQ